MDHTIDANTQERKASEFERHGERYYPVDPDYDKRVYENTWGNIGVIVLVLFAFWICNSLHWWGIFCLGIVDADALVIYSGVCFVFTLVFLGSLLFSGRGANKLKRQHEFLLDRIAEKRTEIQEKETKHEQEEAHEKKLKQQAAKMVAAAASKAEEEAAMANLKVAEKNRVADGGFVANIQDKMDSNRGLLQPDNRA